MPTEASRRTSRERALAALQYLALGDALGMPTQSMSPDEIVRYYGSVFGLLDAVPEQPVAPAMPAGSVTDDTEQALLMADLLVEGGGRVETMCLVEALLTWEDSMIVRGSRDLLGPSTKAALDQVRAGVDPHEVGKDGTTNGSAMRVAPVGIAFMLDDLAAFAEAVYSSCRLTHDTVQGWEAAALVAAAVSAGVSGAAVHDAVRTALDVVAELGPRGAWAPRASVHARTRAALDGARDVAPADLPAYLRAVVGTSVDATESIPAAFVVAQATADDPRSGLLLAAGLGGDTDTIAAIAGAILGAGTGPDERLVDDVAAVTRVSALDLEPVVDSLLALRHRT